MTFGRPESRAVTCRSAACQNRPCRAIGVGIRSCPSTVEVPNENLTANERQLTPMGSRLPEPIRVDSCPFAVGFHLHALHGLHGGIETYDGDRRLQECGSSGLSPRNAAPGNCRPEMLLQGLSRSRNAPSRLAPWRPPDPERHDTMKDMKSMKVGGGALL